MRKEMKSIPEIIGELGMTLLNKNGKVKCKRYTRNIIPTTGRQHIAMLLDTGDIDATMIRFAVGTESTAPTAGDTELGNEVARSAFTDSYDPSILAGSTKLEYRAKFTDVITEDCSIWEGGIFNHTETGRMLCFGTLTQAVNFQTGDTLNCTYTITIGT